MMNDSEERRKRIPSKIFDRYWLVHIDEDYKFSKNRDERESGKWLIFDTTSNIDAYWRLIIDSLDNNLLGPSAKVSTSKIKEGFENNDTRVICVFTEDFNDKGDLCRIEKEIRRLGILNELTYKLDSDVGKYKKDGFCDLAKLISPNVEMEYDD